ncbi:MAG: HAMP domain-containing sensor histidine kinase [Firmicutes bacterium]|nr:HAMP domain-containing sensor histidine kinase [Bacillota bacterium]
MKTSITFKVVLVYLTLVIGSLMLAGILTNSAIQNYVIQATRDNLIQSAQRVIHQFESTGTNAMASKPTKAARQIDAVSIAAQSVEQEYVIVDPSGHILWNTFSRADFSMLTQVRGVVVQALQGHIATGLYPDHNPLFEFVAIPFTYTISFPAGMSPPGAMSRLILPDEHLVKANRNTKVIVLFTRISDLQRITSQIWLAVAQGLLIASLITAIVGVIVARRLMRPAGVIKQAILRVRERDFSSIPVVRTGDEWEDFATAFGDMVRSLQAFDDGQKRFLQNASHELKTPLMAIRGYAEGLRDGVFEQSEAFRILDIVAQESVRLKSLVDELIYLSKLETLEEVYTFAPYDMAMIIYATIERVHPLAKERNIRILPDIPHESVTAMVDRDKMVQALLNLASNAVRHARRQIFIRLTAGDTVQVIVEDDGEGFRDGDETRVFERFFHGAKGDTGLGLPIAKAIIDKHRGDMYAINASGAGARFVILLPSR